MDDEVKLNPHEQIGSFELLHELLDQFRFFIRPGREKDILKEREGFISAAWCTTGRSALGNRPP
jgi:hypothetical protein